MPKVRFFMGDDTEPFIIKQPPVKPQKGLKEPNQIKEKIQSQPIKRFKYCNFFRWVFGWF